VEAGERKQVREGERGKRRDEKREMPAEMGAKREGGLWQWVRTSGGIFLNARKSSTSCGLLESSCVRKCIGRPSVTSKWHSFGILPLCNFSYAR
jgi:hypothetical protein